MSLVHNERVKLTATFLNTLASASVVAGGITSVIALLYGFGATNLSGWLVALFTAMWILVGAGLHMCARFLLGRMKP
jgi:hypothetical protein